MKNVTQKLYDKLFHDFEMDGFGQGYEAGVKECIEIVSAEENELNQQRDELLEALTTFKNQYRGELHYFSLHEKAKELIQKLSNNENT